MPHELLLHSHGSPGRIQPRPIRVAEGVPADVPEDAGYVPPLIVNGHPPRALTFAPDTRGGRALRTRDYDNIHGPIEGEAALSLSSPSPKTLSSVNLGDLESKFGGSFSEYLDLLLAESVLIVLSPFVHVFCAEGHRVGSDGRPICPE